MILWVRAVCCRGKISHVTSVEEEVRQYMEVNGRMIGMSFENKQMRFWTRSSKRKVMIWRAACCRRKNVKFGNSLHKSHHPSCRRKTHGVGQQEQERSLEGKVDCPGIDDRTDGWLKEYW